MSGISGIKSAEKLLFAMVKSVKQLLITQSKWSHIFKLDEDWVVTPIIFKKYQELTLSPINTPPCMFDLPHELIYKTLKISFFDLLHSKNFEDAFDLCLTSKVLLHEIYELLLGPTRLKVSITDQAHHLHSCLYLIELIHDEYLCTPNLSKHSRVGIRLETMPSRFTTGDNKQVAPWDFYPELQTERHGRVIDRDGPANPYLTGPFFGDIVNVYGSSSKGIVAVTQMHHPVLTFILSTIDEVLIPDEANFWHNRPFKRFTKLLKIIFGPRTGVYFMVKPFGNEFSPFISQSDTFYKFA